MEELFEKIERLFNVKNGDMGITNIDQWRENQLKYIKKEYLSSQLEPLVMLLKSGKPADPIQMIKEIEAYLTFRLLGDEPSVPVEDMQKIKDDLNELLFICGYNVNFKPA